MALLSHNGAGSFKESLTQMGTAVLARAMTACKVPVYCSDECHFRLERSLVNRVYEASEVTAERVGFATDAGLDSETREIFTSRLALVTSDEPNSQLFEKAFPLMSRGRARTRSA